MQSVIQSELGLPIFNKRANALGSFSTQNAKRFIEKTLHLGRQQIFLIPDQSSITQMKLCICY